MSITLGLALFCVLLYLINHYLFGYWKRRNFPYAEPIFLIGNLGQLLSFKVSFNEFMRNLYIKYKNHKYIGIFFSYKPVLLVNDPEIIQQIMIKDFQSFHDRPMPITENDPISQNLFFLKGRKWRELRVKLTPIFTSSKLKAMFPILSACGKVLHVYIDNNLKQGNNVIEFKDLLSRLTINNISSIAFGIENDCINDRDSVFRKMGISIFTGSIKRGLVNFIALLLPNLMEKLNIHFASKEIEDFFLSIVKQTIDYREKNNIVRNDFMELMIQLKNQGYVTADKDDTNGVTDENGSQKITKLTINEIVAQAFVFFAAGFETSSSTMAFTLFELCKNSEIMKNVQKEIDSVMAGEQDITYEMLCEMKYLECCIDESLRKYPLVPLLRVATQNFKLPNSDHVVESGTTIHIPILGIHRNPEIYEDPTAFKPERFLNSSHGNGKGKGLFYMPFGDGPRSCIGARMGKLQAKLGLALVLSKYNLKFNDEKLMEGEMTFDVKQSSLGLGKKLDLKVTAR